MSWDVCSLKGACGSLGKGLEIPQSQQEETNPTGNIPGEQAVGFPAGFSCRAGSFCSVSLMAAAGVYLGVWVLVSAGSFSPSSDISLYAINHGDQGQDRNCFGHVVSVLVCGLGVFLGFFHPLRSLM